MLIDRKSLKKGEHYGPRYNTARDLAYTLRGFITDYIGNRHKVFPQSHFYRDAADRFISLFKIQPERSYRLTGRGYSYHSGSIKNVVTNLFCDRDRIKRSVYVHSSTQTAIEGGGYRKWAEAMSDLDCIFYTKDNEKLQLLMDFSCDLRRGSYERL